MKRQSLRTAAAQNRKALELFAQHGRTPTVTNVRDWGDLRRTLPNEELLPKRDAAECGTPGGYKRHQRANEPACRPCRNALSGYRRKLRMDAA